MLAFETVPASEYRRLHQRCEELEAENAYLRTYHAAVGHRPRWPSLLLTPGEERVLAALEENHGVVSRVLLEEAACRDVDGSADPENVLRVTLHRLRRKTLKRGVWILTHYGKGYELTPPARLVLATLEAGS